MAKQVIKRKKRKKSWDIVQEEPVWRKLKEMLNITCQNFVRFYHVSFFCSIIIPSFVLSMLEVFYNTSAFETRKLLRLKDFANHFDDECSRFNIYYVFLDLFGTLSDNK